MARLIPSDPTGIAIAARHLAAGELVALPTETVYGLGANARDPVAIAKVFAAKGRPADHPLIVHIAEPDCLLAWADPVPDDALKLASAFWPGPLTMILSRKAGVPDAVTGGQSSVGLRCPSHPVARALLRAFAQTQAVPVAAGVAAPSANLFGRISPTSAQHVLDDFSAVDLMVLDGEDAEVGLESTIVDLSRPDVGPVVLRPGAILESQIASVLGHSLGKADAAAPRVSGALASHYAPVKPLHLMTAQEIARIESSEASRLAILAFTLPADGFSWQCQAPRSPAAYAHGLYQWLRQMDNSRALELVVERVPDGEDWLAIADRLQRAAA
jgi:L-threonylcarbamoyladenylate synthase